MKHLVATTIAAATLAGPALAEQYVCETEQMVGVVNQSDHQSLG